MRLGSSRRAATLALLLAAGAHAAAPCDKPLYLTFDTGHMAVAPLVAEVLARQQVKATFFLASEKTQTGRQQPGRQLGAVVEGACRRRPCLRLAHLGPRQLAGRHAAGPAHEALDGPRRRQGPGAERGRLLPRA